MQSGNCQVCHLSNLKLLGKHYGALTCLACRAFFRRAQTRKRALLCKRLRRCPVDPTIRKCCSSCRYEKCLSVGMRPELVLNEEQKNRRFRSSFSLRCENVSTDQRQQQASSSGTEGEGADQYEDVAVQAIEEAPELKTEPFVRVSVIQQNRQTPPYVPAVAEPLCLSDRSVLVQEEIDIMWHYIHKKFRRKKETELILRRPTSAPLSRFDEDEDKVDFDLDRNPYCSSSLYSSIIYCNSQVETNEIVNQLRYKFESSWSAVNFGEKIISSYMNFCHSKHEFQPAFWHIVNHNLRKRCLSFLTSLDLFQNMSAQGLFRILRGNLYNVSMLAYIYITNQTSADAELQFIMGSKDYDQWESRDRTLTTGVPFSQMIQFFPCEDKERLGFHLTVFEHCVPIFGDKNVIILMMLNLIFNDEKTEHLNNMILNILERYLKYNSTNGVSFEMKNIRNCLRVLPKLSNTFEKSFQ